ncbi:MAG: MurR/RpiR family transcriptional regulator [Lachnospiraceae bacterium]|nr:MurR/RpiR family transcriptional regulator [Lachnospiraceae bacterium]
MFYGKLPILLLAEVSGRSANSTNSQIASYILNHLEEVRNDSIRDLAGKCFVSPSSISRFCRDMGLNDFAELRELIAETDLKFEISSDSQEAQVQKKDFVRQVQEGIAAVCESLDMRQVDKLVKDIACYEKVSAFGLLKAETAAMNLQTNLLMLGKVINTKVHFSQQIAYMEQADEKDLIILFSYTGIYFDYEYSQNRIHPNIKRPKIYFVTGNPYVKRSAFLNEILYFRSEQNQPSHPYQLQVAADLIAQAYAHSISKN